MKITDINIDLDNTITCGQCFRWKKEIDNSYTIILRDRVINIKQKENSLLVESDKTENLKQIVMDYLDLFTDYTNINNILITKDKNFKKYTNESIGFKIINQDPFETLISYIISQNNSVKRIMKSIELLSKDYGEKIKFNNKEYFLFPKLSKLSTLKISDFRKYGVGFRDKYLYETIKNICNKQLDLKLIESMNSDEALKYLTLNKGIGSKVASCILLFSYRRYDVFPVDTWVKKSFLELYPNIKNTQKEIEKFAKETYGEYSAVALQYLFNYKRNKNSI